MVKIKNDYRMAYREGKIEGIPLDVLAALDAEKAELAAQEKPKKKDKEEITVKE
jgi:hypothetical protein